MIDSKNEQIELLKKGLKGIVWRYGYQTVQDSYRSYYATASAFRDYQGKVKSWESTYGKSKSQQRKRLRNEWKGLKKKRQPNITIRISRRKTEGQDSLPL